MRNVLTNLTALVVAGVLTMAQAPSAFGQEMAAVDENAIAIPVSTSTTAAPAEYWVSNMNVVVCNSPEAARRIENVPSSLAPLPDSATQDQRERWTYDMGVMVSVTATELMDSHECRYEYRQ